MEGILNDPLRYPIEAIHKTTDYLNINIRKYKASGFGNETIRGNLDEEKFSNGPYTVNNNEIVDGNNMPLYENTVGNRLQLGIDSDIKYNPKRRTIRTQAKDLGSIYLPIPSNIQDGNSVTFGAGELDGLTAKTFGILNQAFTGSGFDNFGQTVSNLAKDGSRLALSPEAQDYFLNNIAASAANIPFGGNLSASQILARTQGKILNPNMELLFKGVNLRSFKFSFKMTPRSEKEAIQIKEIIKKLKKNMSPQAEDIYLGSPNIFRLEYRQGNRPHPFLHKFKECALTDMSVNYTGEGTYATYGGKESAPVSMIMDLGFKELEPIYSSDYDTESGKTGVGY